MPSPDRIVDRAVDEDALRSTTIEIAQAQVSKAGNTVGTIKARMYAPALAAPREKGNPLGRLRSRRPDTRSRASGRRAGPPKQGEPHAARPRHPLLPGLVQTSGTGPAP